MSDEFRIAARDGRDVQTLFCSDAYQPHHGTIRVECWPEGIVFWVGGEIKWKSWEDKKGARLASRPSESEVSGTVADLDDECERYVADQLARVDLNDELEIYALIVAKRFWRAKAKGRPLP